MFAGGCWCGQTDSQDEEALVASSCSREGARLCNNCLAAGGGCCQPVVGLVAGQECLCSKVPGAEWHSWQSEVSTHLRVAASRVWGHWPPVIADLKEALYFGSHSLKTLAAAWLRVDKRESMTSGKSMIVSMRPPVVLEQSSCSDSTTMSG